MTTLGTGKTTTFAEAVHVQPAKGSESIFTAEVPQDWCGTPAAHGGYLQALIFSTARTYFATRHPARNLPDPINSYTQFLKPVWAGHVRLLVKAISLGSRVSVIQIDLQARDVKSQEFKTCVLATVTQGNLATERGISLPTEPILKKEEIPDRDRDCEDHTVSDFVKEVAPGSFKLNGRVLKGGGVNRKVSDRRGMNCREIWYTFADGSAWDVPSLGYLTDMFSGAPNNYSSNEEDYRAGIIYPTLSMATEIKKDPKDSKWLFMRIKAHEIKNGRFDTEVVVVDESGELVALSKHVSLILARNAPEELKRIYRL